MNKRLNWIVTLIASINIVFLVLRISDKLIKTEFYYSHLTFGSSTNNAITDYVFISTFLMLTFCVYSFIKKKFSSHLILALLNVILLIWIAFLEAF